MAPAPKDRAYARHALLGIAPPQSNPVVEAEFSALLPDGVGMLVTRLTGTLGDPRARFRQYLENLDASLAAFGAAGLDGFGLAVTSTAYLFGDAEDRILDAVAARIGGPAISAGQAVRRALDRLGARRIALFSPYPDWLTEESVAYWRRCGYEVVSWARVPEDTADTLNIYRLTAAGVLRATEALDTARADVVLLTGTGMATLPAIPALAARSGTPVLSANLCLAWALLDALGLADLAPPTAPGDTLIGGWQDRLHRL